MTADRRIYLKMTGAAQAGEILLSRVAELPESPDEIVSTTKASGRVTGRAVYAHASSPVFPAAAMDGYAVRSALTFGASEAVPVTLVVPDQAQPVNTGHSLPPDADAVYKIEDVEDRKSVV